MKKIFFFGILLLGVLFFLSQQNVGGTHADLPKTFGHVVVPTEIQFTGSEPKSTPNPKYTKPHDSIDYALGCDINCP